MFDTEVTMFAMIKEWTGSLISIALVGGAVALAVGMEVAGTL
jgi:hypothetical protein